jgi:putative colanic acid biosynthesis glycosyltransferase
LKISIITIHLNDFTGLDRTLNSLNSLQDKTNLEWVVIDGGSKPRGANIEVFGQVKSLANHFMSEPDEGIYDAMNKGARQASGNYVLFLNAGDELHPDFDLQRFNELASVTEADMIWGRCQERYENGALIQVKTRSPSWAWYGMPAYHPAIFFRRETLGNSPYDTSYRIAADYDLICRLLTGGARVEKLNSLVSTFHHGGLSDIQGATTRDEENQIRLKYFKVPAIAGNAIKIFKGMNAQLAKIAWFRRLWRRWI